MTRDLVQCLFDNLDKIGPVSSLFLAIETCFKLDFSEPTTVRSAFTRIGQCEDLILHPMGLELLNDYYLIWYKENSVGESGPGIPDSPNYRLYESYNELLIGSDKMMNKVNSSGIINKLRNGLRESPIIITIEDTTIHKSLILDGTKRLLALFYIRATYPNIYSNLDFSIYPIKLLQMKSSAARILFPLDFWKLV